MNKDHEARISSEKKEAWASHNKSKDLHVIRASHGFYRYSNSLGGS